MNKNQAAAYVHAQATCAIITAIAMQAMNLERAASGLAPAYSKEDFLDLLDEFCIGNNAVLDLYASAEQG